MLPRVSFGKNFNITNLVGDFDGFVVFKISKLAYQHSHIIFMGFQTHIDETIEGFLTWVLQLLLLSSGAMHLNHKCNLLVAIIKEKHLQSTCCNCGEETFPTSQFVRGLVMNTMKDLIGVRVGLELGLYDHDQAITNVVGPSQTWLTPIRTHNCDEQILDSINISLGHLSS